MLDVVQEQGVGLSLGIFFCSMYFLGCNNTDVVVFEGKT